MRRTFLLTGCVWARANSSSSRCAAPAAPEEQGRTEKGSDKRHDPQRDDVWIVRVLARLRVHDVEPPEEIVEPPPPRAHRFDLAAVAVEIDPRSVAECDSPT